MIVHAGYSQEHQPPIPVEVLLGNEAFFSQLVLNRDFTPNSKLSLFSLATFTADHNQAEKKDELSIISQITYHVGKGFGVMGGVNMNSAVGLSPVIGPKHVFASQKFLAVSILSYSLNGEQDVGFFGLYSFTPPINEQISFYSRIQVLFNQSIGESHHNRSFLYVRAGLERNKLHFGVGANLDQYGPDKTFLGNYGGFVGWDF